MRRRILTAEQKSRKAAKAAAWYVANRDKALAVRAAYYKANRAKTLAKSALWIAANRDRRLATAAAWYAANRKRERAKRVAYRKANLEKTRTTIKKWRADNLDAQRIYNRNRRASKKASGRLSRDVVSKLRLLQRGKCACCRVDIGKHNTHIDHIEPISKGGPNVDRNVQLLCADCNFSKNARHPIEFMQSRGYLL